MWILGPVPKTSQRDLNEIRLVFSLCLIHLVPLTQVLLLLVVVGLKNTSMTDGMGREAWEIIHCKCLCFAFLFIFLLPGDQEVGKKV